MGFLRYAITLGSLSFGIIGFALPIYAKQLGVSALDIGGMISVFAIMITVARPLVGRGIDHFGRKRFLSIAFVFYAIAMGLFGIAHDINMLYLARFVQGIGSSLLWIPAYTVATELTSRDWGQAVGSIDGASSQGWFYGTFFGFFILFSLSFELGWQLLFIIYAVLALCAAFLVWWRVPESNLVSIEENKQGEGGDRFESKRMVRLMIIVFMTGISYAMISPLLIIFLQDRFTSDVRTLAMAFIPAGLVYAYLPGRMGNLSDRYGRTPFMAVGLIGAGIVSFFIPVLNRLLFLSFLWMLEAIGFVMANPAEAALVADLTGSNVRGRGYGFYTFAQGAGLTIGPLLGGWLYDSVGHALPFYLNGLILFIGAGLVLILLGRKAMKTANG